tara:strand:+ start:545 stop:832 length:288 start_codon:yes stop_codon:yes gene_type:complete
MEGRLIMRTTERQSRDEEPSIDDMRYDIAEAEAMNMTTSHVIELLMDGYEGLENIPDNEIVEEWNLIFGEEEEEKGYSSIEGVIRQNTNNPIKKS